MHTSSPSLQSSLNQPTFQIKIAKKLSFTFFFQPSSLPFPSLAYPCCFHLLTYTPSPCLLSFSQVFFFLSLKGALIPQNIYIYLYTCQELHYPLLTNNIIDSSLVYDIFASLFSVSNQVEKQNLIIEELAPLKDKRKKKKKKAFEMEERVFACLIFLLLGHFLCSGKRVPLSCLYGMLLLS